MHSLEAMDLGIKDGLGTLHVHERWLTPLMRFITTLGNTQVLAVVVLLATLFFIFIGRWRVGICLMAAAVASYGIEQTVKPWVGRPRPTVAWAAKQDVPSSPSFPSGHALLSMTVYGTLALSLAAEMERRRTKLLLIAGGLFVALLIGFSRMYLGVHYLTDVLGGLCAGLGCALLFRWIELQWTAVYQPAAAAATVPFQSAHSTAASEPLQHSGSEHIQT
jgi:undecaprenyl-diphosphatase